MNKNKQLKMNITYNQIGNLLIENSEDISYINVMNCLLIIFVTDKCKKSKHAFPDHC
jgi:hypothetical protein